MRILGIDYGQARIGVAKSDPTGLIAEPHLVLRRKTDELSANEIARLAIELEASRIVVGWPRNMNGSVGPGALSCVQFADLLRETTGLPVDLYDERLTTVAAERLLISAEVNRKNRKKVIDALAASIMLQGYLDRRRQETAQESSPRSEE